MSSDAKIRNRVFTLIVLLTVLGVLAGCDNQGQATKAEAKQPVADSTFVALSGRGVWVSVNRRTHVIIMRTDDERMWPTIVSVDRYDNEQRVHGYWMRVASQLKGDGLQTATLVARDSAHNVLTLCEISFEQRRFKDDLILPKCP